MSQRGQDVKTVVGLHLPRQVLAKLIHFINTQNNHFVYKTTSLIDLDYFLSSNMISFS
jgi:hypothetical protein